MASQGDGTENQGILSGLVSPGVNARSSQLLVTYSGWVMLDVMVPSVMEWGAGECQRSHQFMVDDNSRAESWRGKGKSGLELMGGTFRDRLLAAV